MIVCALNLIIFSFLAVIFLFVIFYFIYAVCLLFAVITDTENWATRLYRSIEDQFEDETRIKEQESDDEIQ